MIDFDLLRQELSGNLVEGPRERYHLDRPGKREALLAANAPQREIDGTGEIGRRRIERFGCARLYGVIVVDGADSGIFFGTSWKLSLHRNLVWIYGRE